MSEHVPVAEYVVHPLFCGYAPLTKGSTKAGNIEVPVRGTSYKQFELLSLTKTLDLKKDGLFSAQLVLDSNNPDDGKAIAVFMGEYHIGYLGKAFLSTVVPVFDKEAGQWKNFTRYYLISQGIHGLRGNAAICKAFFVGGEPKPKIGVRVFLSGSVFKSPGNPVVKDEVKVTVFNPAKVSFTYSPGTAGQLYTQSHSSLAFDYIGKITGP